MCGSRDLGPFVEYFYGAQYKTTNFSNKEERKKRLLIKHNKSNHTDHLSTDWQNKELGAGGEKSED